MEWPGIRLGIEPYDAHGHAAQVTQAELHQSAWRRASVVQGRYVRVQSQAATLNAAATWFDRALADLLAVGASAAPNPFAKQP